MKTCYLIFNIETTNNKNFSELFLHIFPTSPTFRRSQSNFRNSNATVSRSFNLNYFVVAPELFEIAHEIDGLVIFSLFSPAWNFVMEKKVFRAKLSPESEICILLAWFTISGRYWYCRLVVALVDAFSHLVDLFCLVSLCEASVT